MRKKDSYCKKKNLTVNPQILLISKFDQTKSLLFISNTTNCFELKIRDEINNVFSLEQTIEGYKELLMEYKIKINSLDEELNNLELEI